jgi:hypothetical protein
MTACAIDNRHAATRSHEMKSNELEGFIYLSAYLRCDPMPGCGAFGFEVLCLKAERMRGL